MVLLSHRDYISEYVTGKVHVRARTMCVCFLGYFGILVPFVEY